MPITYTYTPLAPSDTVSVDAYRAAIVRATPKDIKFGGLELALPFGKRGSMATRNRAKTYGARWDGTRWTVPSNKAAPGCGVDDALAWFLQEGLATRLVTYTYTPWVWTGDTSRDLILNVPFARKDLARNCGARWCTRRRVWFVPGANLTRAVVDACNREEWCAGAWDAATGTVLPNTAAAPAAPAVGVPATGHVPNHLATAVLNCVAAVTSCGIAQPDPEDAHRAVAALDSELGTSIAAYWLSRHGVGDDGATVTFVPVPGSRLRGAGYSGDSDLFVVAVVPHLEFVRHSAGGGPAIARQFPVNAWIAGAVPAVYVLTPDAAANVYESLTRTHGWKPATFQAA